MEDNTLYREFIEDENGFRFTEEGLKELRPYFAKGGININNIKSKKEYYAARRACSHLFLDHLIESTAKGKMTLERRVMLAVFSRDTAEAERLMAIIKKRNALNLRVV